MQMIHFLLKLQIQVRYEIFLQVFHQSIYLEPQIQTHHRIFLQDHHLNQMWILWQVNLFHLKSNSN
ncbi:hypothetical protein GLOIN_2v1523692 [Rhizophagus irregularis DAOM 181602=DAOM 197198]|uniref:Uncharacterized protein n=1 Tax=Rhizophagus irregularis (strain DAOM 181602 / DAOM 197198 / MUCL 43194) TaxID=747089 RepID=A0A2P4QQF1_RHIID|nr:hypothetical protein GLOIN_2v1523692 [Rhizophagus irregularis DAOM 181602=DAOM 197198]POG79860.1 hypothetical protein GLOIN_2v1523692 [Rhizophagus irregularis DAOM 181602=DAOM 197198]|eukprot:XP_025186726.1 hypothetical protein GLOIN_2v1523692 [Rhizophagus irregularis DAOM 181602=DAOM 197198]